MMDGWNGSWGWMVAMMLLMLVAVLAVVWFVRSVNGTRSSSDDADETLRQRFARGEISADEFHSMQQDLGRRDR